MADTRVGRPRQLATVELAAVHTRDGIVLATDVYRPPRRRVPALLLRTPYDRRDLRERIQEVDPLLAVRRGLAVVIQDVRGRGGSGGVFEPLVPDALDGADAIGWIRRQPWSDGRVAMVGASYNGCVQFRAAHARPEGLVAIAPTVSGAVRPVFHPGGALRLAAIDGWVTMLVGEALRGELDAAARDELDDAMRASALERYHALMQPSGALARIAAPLRRWISTPPPDRYWTETTAVPSDPLPAVHTTGVYDVCQAAAIEAYSAWSAVADPAAPQALTLGPWDHGLAAVYPELGLGEAQSPPALVALERQLAFFDAVLGRARAQEPAPVMSFVLGRNRWHEDVRWPPAGVRSLELRLAAAIDEDGGLVGAERGAQQAVRYSYDPRSPVPTLGGAHSVWGLTGPLEQTAIESRSDVLTFTSARFDAELEIAGAPIARLVVASSAPATDFIARLALVQADGRSLPLVHGIWSGRVADLPAAARSNRRCEIQLGSIHMTLAPGARLRLQVTSSCYPDIYPNPNTGHDPRLGPPSRVQTAEQSLLVSGGDGSSLLLPVRGAPPRDPRMGRDRARGLRPV